MEENKENNKEELIKYFTIENKNGARTIEKYLMKSNSELYLKIIEWNHNYKNITFKEKIYRYIYSIQDTPKCKSCGKPVKFTNSLIDGYRTYCSKQCSGSSLDRMDNAKKTCIDKYGVDNPLKLQNIKDKVKQTNLKKYGFTNPSMSDEIKNKIKEKNKSNYGVEYYFKTEDFKKKYKNAMLRKYNVDHYFKTNDFKVKYKKTMNERYHVNNPLKSKVILNKIRKTVDKKIYDRFLRRNYKIIKFEKDTLTVIHPDGHVFKDNRKLIINRFNNNNEPSTILQPRHTFYEEEWLYKYIRNLLNIKILRNKRRILNGLELDIYIPDKKIAIEFDGIYWHSELFKEKNYHLNKTEICEQHGIQLLHIFEDEWINKNEIVKSIIKSKLGVIDNKIYARKCVVKEIDNKESKKFVESNHIQGGINSKFNIGLFYNDELVSVMTFGNKRISLGNKISNNDEYEMLRFCNKLNTSVIGGASKLLKYFIKAYQPKSILTFADRRYSQGNLYKQLGFDFIENTDPNYWYLQKHVTLREDKIKYSKDNLVKEGFDAQKTEHQIMSERGYLRIYDCGHMKFELKLQQ